MRTPRAPRPTAAQAEHLLDGGRGTGPLPHLLAAAAAPGGAHELAGEAAARAAFAAAQFDRTGSPVRLAPARRSIGSRLIAAKALAAVVLAASATGGVALAASSTLGSQSHPASGSDPASVGRSVPASTRSTPPALTTGPAVATRPDVPGPPVDATGDRTTETDTEAPHRADTGGGDDRCATEGPVTTAPNGAGVGAPPVDGYACLVPVPGGTAPAATSPPAAPVPVSPPPGISSAVRSAAPAVGRGSGDLGVVATTPPPVPTSRVPVPVPLSAVVHGSRNDG